jgi:hypothetical protein
MISVLTVALIFSLWGLIAGITFTTFVMMVGGSAAFASIFSGTFSVSFVGAMSLECRTQCFSPPEKKPDENFSVNPPSFVPEKEMMLTKSNKPFFSKTKEDYLDQKNNVLPSVMKVNHR